MSAALTREEIKAFSQRLEAEGMRGCYDGNESTVFFQASATLARAADKLRPKEQPNVVS